MREGLHKIVSLEETIVAISTGLVRSAIGLVRVSGRNSLAITQPLFRSGRPLQHRQATVGLWCDLFGDMIDEVVVTYFESPRSYTGEDLIEISAHGNPLVLNRIVETILKGGARLAGPGEFTLRAVANQKMDLMQAEAVRDFVEAQTERQARTALRQIEGAASKRLLPMKDQLVQLVAILEAGIDFAEDDVDVLPAARIVESLSNVIEGLNAIEKTFGYGRMLAEGARVAIVGKPNVGKSSLFNRLLESDRAIVTDTPGTTRDVLTETIDLSGIPLRIADTAGLRETSNEIERIGVGRSMETVSEADITLVVLDSSRPFDADDERALRKTESVPRIIVINKVDLASRLECPSPELVSLRVSALSGTGVDDLRKAIGEFLVGRNSDASEDFVLTSRRQRESLEIAIGHLRIASEAVVRGVPHEMVLLDLYAALSALGELTGDVVTEDILDRIFSSFCIGK